MPDAPPDSGARRYEIRTTDIETGETLVGYARCDRPPSAETRDALATLLQMAVAAVRDGTLTDEAHD